MPVSTANIDFVTLFGHHSKKEMDSYPLCFVMHDAPPTLAGYSRIGLIRQYLSDSIHPNLVINYFLKPIMNINRIKYKL